MINDKRNYVVFGATGTIASALSAKLRDQGHQLFLTGRNTDKLRTLSDSLKSPGAVCDATSNEEVAKVMEQALEKLGTVHGVVNCVGSLLIKPAHLTSEDEWQNTIDTNLKSAFLIIRNASKSMIRTGGSIVLLSSAAGRYGMSNHEAIAASKAGVIGLTKSAASTYASRGIRVNCVAPGFVETQMTAEIAANETTMQAITYMHPLGKTGTPVNIASAIGWLLDEEQNWITGQVIGVDGGLSTVQPRLRVSSTAK